MRITLDGWACLLGAVLLLTLPTPWVLSALLAGGIHELCHLAILLFTKSPVSGVHIGINGAVITAPALDSKTELICAAAGPMGSLSLLLLVHLFPRLALCGAVQGLFNLLPIYPMDGGRILNCLLGCLLPDRNADWLAFVVEFLALAGILCVSLFLSVSFGLLPLLMGGILALRVLVRKRPCKESKLAVQ